MASPAHGDLAYSLSKFYFGEEVGNVIYKLFSFDQLTLQGLINELPQMKRESVKKALLLAVKYQMVDFVKRVKNFRFQYEYTLAGTRLYSIFRMTKFIDTYKKECGEYSSVILDCISVKALISKEKLMDMVIDRINLAAAGNPTKSHYDPCIKTIIDSDFEQLVASKYVVLLSDNVCLNMENLNRYYRDNLIAETIYNYYNKDTRVKAMAQTMLKISCETTSFNATVTSPIPFAIIAENLIPNHFNDRAQVESYLGQLSSESNNRFIVSLGIQPGKGHMYAIDSGLVIDYLVKETLSSMVTSRFGPRCCRIFRVLLRRGPLLLKQIEECVMLPAKDVREYSYMLIKEGLLHNQQVPKTPDLAPSKSVFILCVELDQVVYQASDHCCRAITNLIIRYDHELLSNKIILDKSKGVQELIKSESLPEDSPESMELWNQYFNSHELLQLKQVKSNLNRILLAKAQIDDMLFLLETWTNLRPDLRDEKA